MPKLKFGLRETEVGAEGQKPTPDIGQHGTELFRIRAAHRRERRRGRNRMNIHSSRLPRSQENRKRGRTSLVESILKWTLRCPLIPDRRLSSCTTSRPILAFPPRKKPAPRRS